MAMAEVNPVPHSPESEELKSKTGMVKMSEEEAAKLGLVALISRMEWRHVVDRINESPEESREKQIVEVDGIETMGYALHLAVSKKPPRHVVDALMEGYPDAIRSRDEKFGQLPLHIACIYTASAQVLRALVEGHEESLRITDKEHGRLPLHFACLYGSPFEISLLVSAEQRALIFKDADGKTPMDLAEESNNPHREAILKRLKDRTRVVTDAMHHRRKQQHSENPLELKSKRSSLRRAASKRGDLLSSSQGSTGSEEKRRSKSMAVGSNEDEVLLKKPSNTLSRRKSMHVHETDQQRRRASRSSKSGSNGVTLEQKRRTFRRAYTLDDSDIGKKSKSSRRKRDVLQKPSRRTFSRGPIAPMAVKDDEEEEDVEKTPKLKNGKESLLARLQAEHEDDQIRPLQAEPLDSMTTNRENTKPRRDKLAMFLQAHAPDDSSDDEADHKSMGAKSLPAHMASTFLKQRPREFTENKRIAKSYMFDDSSDDGGGIYSRGPRTLKGFSADDTARTVLAIGSTVQKSSELISVESRISDLDVRRQALSQECEAIYESVGKKEDDAQWSRETINELKLQMQELQERLQKEQSALMLSETGIQLQKETLAVHEIKIKAVDSEKSQLLETKSKLEAAESVSNAVTSD